MLKKIIVAVVMAMALLAVIGCTKSNTNQNSSSTPPESSEVDASSDISQAEPEENPQIEDLFAGLVENNYEGLEISAEILPRNAILPGMSVPITIIIANNGDKEINYVQGSGSFTIPLALTVEANGLQPVISEDKLGIYTTDYVTRQLLPGESIRFVMNVMTVVPNANFDAYTFELLNKEEAYIADLTLEEIQDKYPDIEVVEPGKYEGSAYFKYFVAPDEGEMPMMPDANSYAKADFAINVN